jgi:gas vesicle protein
MMRDPKSFDMESSGGSGFLMGVICGAAVGAAVGLLMAPKAGSELRQQLYETTGRLRRRAVDGYAEAVDTVTGAMDDVMDRGKKAVQHGQETYDRVKAANGLS